MCRVHVVIGRKGGVGKSLISSNMAAVCADVQPPRDDGGCAAALGSIDPQATSLFRAALLDQAPPFDTVDLSQPESARILDNLKALPHRNLFVDTPGFHDISDADAKAGRDPLGDGKHSQMLRKVLAQADDAIVPITTEVDSYRPTFETIEYLLRPLGIPFTVVINNWPPSEGQVYVDDTRAFCARYGWKVAKTVIRRYRVHTNAVDVCTRYKPSRLNLQAAQDFYRFALEHGLSGAGPRLAEIQQQTSRAAVGA